MRIQNKRMIVLLLLIGICFLGLYNSSVFAQFKSIDEYKIHEEIMDKKVEKLTADEMKKIGEYLVAAQLSVFALDD
ncbi:putative transcriptional regulator, Bla/Mec [Bacillus clarus]|uniref:Putative transcriptional regulator, Bla/Mec n=1 Tax=Bacillus clarus TaxID=2338372 RepID=A0A090YWM8_9BACI|nr:hypothetical protein [Bacillus clarus]KFN02448.1 putative transcriptional regulator, Bla/Mec [Bacillus clarus]